MLIISKLPFYTLAFFIIYICFFELISDKDFLALELNTVYPTEIYRYYTYSLLHVNTSHIAINLYTWIIFSTIIEYDSGIWRTFLIHFVSIIGGAFGIGWQGRINNKTIRVVGASGGIYGMLSSLIGDLVLNWAEFSKYKKFSYISILSATIVSDIIVNILYYNPRISYSNHIGGFVYGIFGGLLFSVNRKIHLWEKRMQISVGGIITTITLASFLNLILL